MLTSLGILMNIILSFDISYLVVFLYTLIIVTRNIYCKVLILEFNKYVFNKV